MNSEEFRAYGHELIDWMASYFENIETYPVRSQVKPGDIISQLPDSPPETGESFEHIFEDFERIIMPGMTHWQHPKFFAYFPANSSYSSVLAEMLTAALGAQCMIWQTSPAATELEEHVMQWLREMTGLPEGFKGVIQDSASSATLCSLLTAREQKTDYTINEHGFSKARPMTIYCSEETHSSIEKGAKIAGFGKEYVRKITVDKKLALVPEALEEAIEQDLRDGYIPCCIIATIGTTGSTAIDPLRSIGEICQKYDIWLHVDAALAGTACVIPEMRWMVDGIEYADTYVFNPHKWMFTNFDCSAYFVKDKEALIRTFAIMPEYLKTNEGTEVNNYRDWSIQLGRRFRALKLWFVIRTFGVEGIKQRIKHHIAMAKDIACRIEEEPDFELLAPVPLNTICFRYNPQRATERGMGTQRGTPQRGTEETTFATSTRRDRRGTEGGMEEETNEEKLNRLNAQLLEKLNGSGDVFLTHTTLFGLYTIRFVIGQTYVSRRHVEEAWKLIVDTARELQSA